MIHKMKCQFLFVIFCLHFLHADISGALSENEHLYRGSGYVYPFPNQCLEILDSFAEAAANFTKCSIHFARPIRLCERCISNFVIFDAVYKELFDTVVNGTSCSSIFISHDRLNAVLEYHDSIMNIWVKGNCQTCFNWSRNIPELSSETKHFNTMFNDTTECIVTNFVPNSNNSDEVCQKCMQSYLQLNAYYKSLSTDAIGIDSICMDIVDKMNATRSIWSKTLNCCKLRQTPEIIFLCCTGIISFLPLLFYLVVRYCGPIRDLPNVLRQSRIKQTILRSVRGNTD